MQLFWGMINCNCANTINLRDNKENGNSATHNSKGAKRV